jgi:hypothetical protein
MLETQKPGSQFIMAGFVDAVVAGLWSCGHWLSPDFLSLVPSCRFMPTNALPAAMPRMCSSGCPMIRSPFARLAVRRPSKSNSLPQGFNSRARAGMSPIFGGAVQPARRRRPQVAARLPLRPAPLRSRPPRQRLRLLRLQPAVRPPQPSRRPEP